LAPKKAEAPTDLFAQGIKVINVGLSGFADDLKKQGVQVVQVDWSPPAGGDAETLKLLEKLGV
jgi:FdrA protein